MLPGCDKIVPGMLMAAMRLNIPAIVVPGGPMLPGKYKDMETITLTDMRELIGRTQTGKLTEDELLKIEKEALPGVGTCSMLGTANTMSCLAEALGMSLPGLRPGPCGKRQEAPNRQAVRPQNRGDGEGGSDAPEDHDPGGPPQRDQGEYGDGRVHQQHTPSSGYRP